MDRLSLGSDAIHSLTFFHYRHTVLPAIFAKIYRQTDLPAIHYEKRRAREALKLAAAKGFGNVVVEQ